MWYSSLKIRLQTGSLTFTWVVDIPGRFISRSPMKWGNSQSWNTNTCLQQRSFNCTKQPKNNRSGVTNVNHVLCFTGCWTLDWTFSYRLILILCGVSPWHVWEVKLGERCCWLSCRVYRLAECTNARRDFNMSKHINIHPKVTFRRWPCCGVSLSSFCLNAVGSFWLSAIHKQKQ